MSMKMVTIVCRERMEDEVEVTLSNLGIKGYTLIAGVGGKGKTGTVSGTHGWSDRNLLFLVVLDDEQLTTLVQALKDLQASLAEERGGHEVPIKAFLQSCDQIL